MRPIPATSLGHAHGLLRAIDSRGRLRTDEFVTEFSLDELFPPDLENALGRLRHFVSYGRAAGLVKEDRGVVELTDVGRRYIRAGDAAAPFEISSQQAEWLRRQLREKHMTDSIFHGLAIGLSLLASCPPRDARVDDGLRALDGLPRPRRVGQRQHVADPGRAAPAAAAADRADRRRSPAHADRRAGARRSHAPDPYVADRHRGPAQPGRGRRGPRGRRARMGDGRTAASAGLPTKRPRIVAEPAATSRETGETPVPHRRAVSGRGSVARPPVVPRSEPPAFPGSRAATRGLVRSTPSPTTCAVEAPAFAIESAPDALSSTPPPERPAGVASGGQPEAPAERAASTARQSRRRPRRPLAAASPPPVSPPPVDARRGHSKPLRRCRRQRAVARRSESPAAGLRASRADPPHRHRSSSTRPSSRPSQTAVRRRLVDPGGRRERRACGYPDAVHANIAGALAAGKHVLLTGKRGAGKTALALAVARAAAQAGRRDGATVVTAAPSIELVVDAASRGRWVIADELDQADPDAALAPLSTLLAGVPVTLGGRGGQPRRRLAPDRDLERRRAAEGRDPPALRARRGAAAGEPTSCAGCCDEAANGDSSRSAPPSG